MRTKEGRIYPCDPEKNTVCEKTSCYIHGGGCSHTRHPEFAKVVTEEHMNDHWDKWADEMTERLTKIVGENDCSEFLMEAKAVNSDSCNGDSCPIGGEHAVERLD